MYYGPTYSRLAELAEANTPYVRDNDYYFDDGNVIVLVKNWLFKVHKGLFERRSTVFKTLFSLPQDTQNIEGQSDQNPIVFQDTPEDFQALCWAIYASPQEVLAQQKFYEVDFCKLAYLARISHKYDMASLCDWALDVLEEHSSEATMLPPTVDFKIWQPVVILALAKQCKRQVLAYNMERLMLVIIVVNPHKADFLRKVLVLAERYSELRQFQGNLYYHFLAANHVFDPTSPKRDPIGIHQVATVIGDDTISGLADYQKLRLLQGFWSLSSLRLQLLQAPKLDDNPGCADHARTCVHIWQRWWKGLRRKLERRGVSPNDPFKVMSEVQRGLQEPATVNSSSGVALCNDQIKAQALKMAGDFFDTLADRFMIP